MSSRSDFLCAEFSVFVLAMKMKMVQLFEHSMDYFQESPEIKQKVHFAVDWRLIPKGEGGFLRYLVGGIGEVCLSSSSFHRGQQHLLVRALQFESNFHVRSIEIFNSSQQVLDATRLILKQLIRIARPIKYFLLFPLRLTHFRLHCLQKFKKDSYTLRYYFTFLRKCLNQQ